MALKGKTKGAKAKKAAKKGAGAATGWASPRLDSAKDLARARATDARDWAAPRLESAVGTVNTEVVPRVQTAVNQAGPTLDEAKARGTRAVAALRGVDLAPPPEKKRRGRKVLLVLLGVAFAGGVAAVAWSRRNAAGFDYYSLPADDFGRGEHSSNGAADRFGPAAGRVDADPGQPAMPSTDTDASARDKNAPADGD